GEDAEPRWICRRPAARHGIEGTGRAQEAAMKLFRADAAPRDIADSKTFVGPAHTQRLASDRAGTPVGIYRVDFDEGGRTNWHTHTGAQWLLVVEGRVRVQKAGEPPHDVAAGD